ncbi:hypothetical protein [Rubellimicrobium rubrum]|nr:hypothetical protein [Rubellimicrobium rubrum]
MVDLYAAGSPAAVQSHHVFHLGHSLVGRDMPAMLAQLAPVEHRYESQLGWGTPLRSHWDPDRVPIGGFEAENAHPRYRDAREALASGAYTAFVMTEMVEIKDAIRYHQSAKHLRNWAELARHSNPDIGLYLYETWHDLTDPEGWLNRLELDLSRYWDRKILRPALTADRAIRPIYLIPAGQVLGAFVRDLEGQGGFDELRSREDLFARTPEGKLDTIHMGDLGNYLVALTHYAVLYQRSPVGLPTQLVRADGTPAVAASSAAAQLMQETVWRVVTSQPLSGVRFSEA